MSPDLEESRDVMEICRNGHVVTDRLRSDPWSARYHCDRCGAPTLHACPTCGQDFHSPSHALGLTPIGMWQAPLHCANCGATLPWAHRPRPSPPTVQWIEQVLQRLPLMIRQLRWRQRDRVPFQVEDENDLEDLIRSLLPLHFDDVRLESRTPTYSARTRTDLLLAAPRIALTVKQARPGVTEAELLEQVQQDVNYYEKTTGYRWLIVFVYDPEGLLRDRHRLVASGTETEGEVQVRWVVAPESGPGACE